MSDREIITEMDAFALELLKRARTETEVTLSERLATFNGIGKWVSIKHGLADSDENEGTKLHDLKSRLKSDDVEPTPRNRGPVGDRYRPIPKGVDNHGRDPDEPGIGGGLAKLRAKLPVIGDSANNRGFRRIGRNPGGAPFAPAGGGGSIPADLSGGEQSEPNGDGGGSDVRLPSVPAAGLSVREEGLNAGGTIHQESADAETETSMESRRAVDA